MLSQRAHRILAVALVWFRTTASRFQRKGDRQALPHRRRVARAASIGATIACWTVFACLPASAQDYNQNGAVDAADYPVWQDLLGSNGPQADGDGDFDVDLNDYAIWAGNFMPGFSPSEPVGGPVLSITNLGPNINGNLEWAVLVDPQDTLFANTIDNPDRGFGGSIAVEIGFEVMGTSLVSASKNAANFPFDNPGNNPFIGVISSGLMIQGNQVFAALGSDFFGTLNFGGTNGLPKELLVFETLGTLNTTIHWSGAYGPLGDQGRLAQAGLNYDTSGTAMSDPGPAQAILLMSGFWTDPLHLEH